MAIRGVIPDEACNAVQKLMSANERVRLARGEKARYDGGIGCKRAGLGSHHRALACVAFPRSSAP